MVDNRHTLCYAEDMKTYNWNEQKNEELKVSRGICFEEVLLALEKGCLLDVLEHPNKSKYSNQKLFILKIRDYAYIVPFVEAEKEIFLKTIIPSRKATKLYLGGLK